MKNNRMTLTTISFVLVLSIVFGLTVLASEHSVKAESIGKTYDEVLDYDVVVVGGGAAGLTAAVEAAVTKSTVLLLEKQEKLGGSTAMSAGAVATAARETDPEGAYTADMLYEHWIETAKGNIDTSLARKIADMSAETVAWVEAQGLPMKRVASTYIGKELVLVTTFTDDRERIVSGVGGPKLIDGLLEKAITLNVEIRTSTPAIELLADQAGAVSGIVAQKSDGSKLLVNTKNVVLATGGYSANKDLMVKATPDITEIAVIGGQGNTGDAIRMATALGAKESYSDEVGNGCYIRVY